MLDHGPPVAGKPRVDDPQPAAAVEDRSSAAAVESLTRRVAVDEVQALDDQLRLGLILECEVVHVCVLSQVSLYKMRRLPSPVSVTKPPPSSTTRRLVLETLAVAFIWINTGLGPHANRITPPAWTADTTLFEQRGRGRHQTRDRERRAAAAADRARSGTILLLGLVLRLLLDARRHRVRQRRRSALAGQRVRVRLPHLV